MPSPRPLPEIGDFLKASSGAVRGRKDLYADTRRGSIYDHAAGPMAILFAREADRDRDLFQDTYFSNAKGDALTELVEGRYGTARVLSTSGQGTCRFVRSSAAAGGGTFWKGTRVAVAGGIYQASADTPVPASALIATVPFEAATMGSGTAIAATGNLQLLDPVYDPLWLPTSIVCADGTDFEQADAYRARSLADRLNARSGYLPALVAACQAQGAAYVVMFTSDYGLTNDDVGFAGDFGLNAIYVGDGNFQSSGGLVDACAVALESVRVLGADLWVGGMAQAPVTISALLNLVDSPGRMDLVPIQVACTQALLAYFAAAGAGYTYKLDALTGVMKAANPGVQQVAQWNAPTSDATLSPGNWPATLTRYVLRPDRITLTFTGPA